MGFFDENRTYLLPFLLSFCLIVLMIGAMIGGRARDNRQRQRDEFPAIHEEVAEGVMTWFNAKGKQTKSKEMSREEIKEFLEAAKKAATEDPLPEEGKLRENLSCRVEIMEEDEVCFSATITRSGQILQGESKIPTALIGEALRSWFLQKAKA